MEFKKAFHHLANEEKEKAIRLAILFCQSSKRRKGIFAATIFHRNTSMQSSKN
jgi:hypothetical protein